MLTSSRETKRGCTQADIIALFSGGFSPSCRGRPQKGWGGLSPREPINSRGKNQFLPGGDEALFVRMVDDSITIGEKKHSLRGKEKNSESISSLGTSSVERRSHLSKKMKWRGSFVEWLRDTELEKGGSSAGRGGFESGLWGSSGSPEKGRSPRIEGHRFLLRRAQTEKRGERKLSLLKRGKGLSANCTERPAVSGKRKNIFKSYRPNRRAISPF